MVQEQFSKKNPWPLESSIWWQDEGGEVQFYDLRKGGQLTEDTDFISCARCSHHMPLTSHAQKYGGNCLECSLPITFKKFNAALTRFCIAGIVPFLLSLFVLMVAAGSNDIPVWPVFLSFTVPLFLAFVMFTSRHTKWWKPKGTVIIEGQHYSPVHKWDVRYHWRYIEENIPLSAAVARQRMEDDHRQFVEAQLREQTRLQRNIAANTAATAANTRATANNTAATANNTARIERRTRPYTNYS